MRVLRTEKRSKKSILKDFSPEYSLKKELMQKLKLQYFGHLIRRIDSLEKILMLGKIEGGRKKGRQRMRRLDGITNSMHMSLSKLQWSTEEPGVLQSMRSPRARLDRVTKQRQI